MSQESKSCEKCCCVDSKDNPILEEIDKNGCLLKCICMMCYAGELDESSNSND